DAQHAPLRRLRIDPQQVIVVAPRRALDGHERLAALLRTVDRRVAGVDDVGIAGLHRNAAEVPAAPPDARVAAGQHPGGAGVVRAVEAPHCRVHHGVDPLRLAGSSRPADAPRPRWQAVAPQADLRPVIAAVDRLVEAAAGTAG